MEDPSPEPALEKVEDGGVPPKSLNLAELVPEKKVSLPIAVSTVYIHVFIVDKLPLNTHT